MRILTLTACPHPFAEVQHVDPAKGVLVFRWLNAQQQPVDSGGSVARFLPAIAEQIAGQTPGGEHAATVQYVDPSDATLAAAISAAVNAAPVAVVPIAVSPWQIRRALNASGLRAAVEAAVASANQDTRDGWEFASTIRRDNPMLAGLAAAMGLTSAQLDQLFITAGSYNQ